LNGITPDFKFGEGETKVNIKNTLKSSVAVAALVAVAAPVAPVANAADDTLSSGNKNSLTISGRVAAAIWFADDGSSEDMFISDGAINASRIRWVAKGTLNPNTTAGMTIEMDIPIANEPTADTLGTDANDGTENSQTAAWGQRHHYVWVSNKKFGKISLGRTSTASDGTGESNLTGGGFGGANMLGAYGSGIGFNVTTTGVPVASTQTIATSFSGYDASSRETVLRYDTPSMMGLVAKVGMSGDGETDVGLFYGGKFGGLQVKAAAGFKDMSSSSASTGYNASASLAVLHDSGLNAAVNLGKTNFKSGTQAGTLQASIEDPHNVYWTLGYKAKIFGTGGTNFEFSYSKTEDKLRSVGFDDSEGTMWGISAKQSFDAIGASVAIQYQNFDLEYNNGGTAVTLDDIDLFIMETIFNF